MKNREDFYVETTENLLAALKDAGSTGMGDEVEAIIARYRGDVQFFVQSLMSETQPDEEESHGSTER